jgi:hypothetical protein
MKRLIGTLGLVLFIFAATWVLLVLWFSLS